MSSQECLEDGINFVRMNPASTEKELEKHLQAMSPSSLTTCLQDFKTLENSNQHKLQG